MFLKHSPGYRVHLNLIDLNIFSLYRNVNIIILIFICSPNDQNLHISNIFIVLFSWDLGGRGSRSCPVNRYGTWMLALVGSHPLLHSRVSNTSTYGWIFGYDLVISSPGRRYLRLWVLMYASSCRWRNCRSLLSLGNTDLYNYLRHIWIANLIHLLYLRSICVIYSSRWNMTATKLYQILVICLLLRCPILIFYTAGARLIWLGYRLGKGIRVLSLSLPMRHCGLLFYFRIFIRFLLVHPSRHFLRLYRGILYYQLRCYLLPRLPGLRLPSSFHGGGPQITRSHLSILFSNKMHSSQQPHWSRPSLLTISIVGIASA